MESKVIFRDYQEQQAQDHNDLQDFAERSFDHLVLDAVTSIRRYAGFNVVKTGQAELQVQPGRMYDVLGTVYNLQTTTVLSMVQYLASTFKRYLLLTAVGTDVETDIEERDYLIDVTTGATEPRAVATTRSRVAVLTLTQGVESGDPQKPAVPISHVAIAYILVDSTQVVSIEMLEENQLASTTELDLRADWLEDFAAMIGPKVAALASDLADLQNRVNALAPGRAIQRVAEDLARVKEQLRWPDVAVDYGADFYLAVGKSDYTDSFMKGYDALVMEGCRFPDANANEFEISLFSANDPNAAVTNGILLPKYTTVFKFGSSVDNAATTDLGMAQYGFQTVEMKVGYMSRSRLRYGGARVVCSNGNQWDQFYGGEPAPLNLYDLQSQNVVVIGYEWWVDFNYNYEAVRYDSWWYDTWKEPYTYAVTIDHTLSGAFIAQSFLCTSDIWATQLSVFITAKGANEDIHVGICEMIAGVPNPDASIVKVTHAQANIVVGWNDIVIPPTFMRKGTKYSIILISNANHKVGMVAGQTYLDGTFYYSTDGIYYQGDLTKDLMFKVWGAKFNNSQVTIEFAPINLDGGFRFIDILAEMWVPNSAQLIWEMRPNGTGEWLPLTRDNTGILATAPPLAQFRARFDGTRDMQAALHLTGSRVHVSRPKNAFRHISNNITLGSASTTINIKVILENFDETPHDHSCKLWTGAGHSVQELPDATTTTLLEPITKRYQREFVFNITPAVTQLIIEQNGVTNSAENTFIIAERTYYSQ